MLMKKLLFVIVLVLCGFLANARVCENVSGRNSVEQLEKVLRGCTVVVGFLEIVLMEMDPSSSKTHFHEVSFPELTEVTGFFLLYRLHGLTSIGKLFPNLTVIRGDTLLANYAFIIYDIPDLQEIGLHNLRYIGGGSTRIQRCPRLCFVDSINWFSIGGPLHKIHYFNENVEDCPLCPADCNGYCWDNNHCQKVDTEECDSECLRCTKTNPSKCNACRSLYLNEGKCVAQCPVNKLRSPETRTCIAQQECTSISTGRWWIFQGACIRKCPEGFEPNHETKRQCTFCSDDCRKECRGIHVMDLEDIQLLRNCTHIKGSLHIQISKESDADELETALGRVKEIEGYLEIRRSHAINSLSFLKKLKVIRGTQLFQGKYALIVTNNENLRSLWDWSNFTLEIEQGTIYFHYNPELCLSEIDKLADVAGLRNRYSILDVSAFSNGDRTVCRHIDLEITVTNLTSTGATLVWNHFAVEPNDVLVGYTLFVTQDPFKNETFADGRDECFGGSWFASFVTSNRHSIESLYPYTQYAFYIRVYTLAPGSGGQTHIQHFTTFSGEPSEVSSTEVILSTSDSIQLSWGPPVHPGGTLTHYLLSLYLQEDNPHFLTQDNYCFHPHYYPPKKSEGEEEEPLEVWTNSTCCKKQKWQEWKRVRRSHASFELTEFTINPISTTFEILHLQHYKLYIIILSACNDLPACSTPILLYQRTQPKKDADDIPPGLNTALNDKGVFVKWPEPIKPNSVILSYLVEHRKTDLENSTTISQCVTRQDYQKAGSGYTIENLSPGNYSVTVKAVSLAGPGRESEAVRFEIPSPRIQSSLLPYLVVVAMFLIIFSLALFYYYRFKKKGWAVFINAHSAESLYADDQYELSREDVQVDVSVETDQNVFGLVCNGFIKSQNRPCTIKFAQKCTSKREINEFLKEAATMKLSNSYHVVSLLGIVSKAQPIMVVMELMAWGDLKSFLKRSKSSETKLTNVEMHRMAAEIADGIMYLSSRKFVHQDLAARNCMVTAGHTVKIVNFGISRDLYTADYFKKTNGEVIPVRWMAPESLADRIFTTDSNVWSYGIILWEIVTLAEQPYQNLSDEDVMRYVIGQRVMEPPPDCPDLLYEMMVACWRWKPKHRPVIANLLKQLQSHVRRNFRLVSFYHSREAAEYKESAKNREYNLPARKIPLLDERQSVRWKKQEEDVELYPEAQPFEPESLNLPSTSSYI